MPPPIYDYTPIAMLLDLVSVVDPEVLTSVMYEIFLFYLTLYTPILLRSYLISYKL